MPFPPRRIVVATDYSESADVALRYAVNLARAFDATIVLAHSESLTPAAVFPEGGVALYLDELPQLRENADRTLRSYATDCVPPDVRCETRLMVASAGHAISDSATEEGAELIVMGTHGRSGMRRLVLGSVAETVLQHAVVPVLTIRHPDGEVAEAELTIRRIFCPIPSCASGQATVVAAAEIARALDAELVLAHIRRREDAVCSCDDVATWRKGHSGVTIVYRDIILSDDPAAQLLHYSREVEANLIILSPDADDESATLLPPKVRREITRHSIIPVLTLEADPRQEQRRASLQTVIL